MFSAHDWYDFYRDVKEAIPEDSLTKRVNVVYTHCFVKTEHASDRNNRGYQTRVLLFFNKAPILWYSKLHNTVDNSKFSSDFIALKIATELVKDLLYKLRVFDIPIEGPTDMLCDKKNVYKDALTPELTLKKKNISIFYHNCTEAVAD